MKTRDVTAEQIDAVESLVGQSSGAWDCVHPAAIISAAVTVCSAERIAALEAERDSERRRKEHFERTAYALETTLQACGQRLNCETGPQVVVELDKVLAERDAARGEVERLRAELYQAVVYANMLYHGLDDYWQECHEQDVDIIAAWLAAQPRAE